MGGIEYVVDGAFVKKATGSSITNGRRTISVTITARPVDTPTEALIAHGNPMKAIPFLLMVLHADDNGTVSDAWNNAVSTGASNAEELDLMCRDQIQSLLTPSGRLEAAGPVAFNRQQFAQMSPALEAALPLIFNAIMYLANHPGSVSERFEDSAPAEWVKAASSHWGKVASKAKSQLACLGYCPVRFVSLGTAL
jgi:hypothetical protein